MCCVYFHHSRRHLVAQTVPLFQFYKGGVLLEAFATRDKERIIVAITEPLVYIEAYMREMCKKYAITEQLYVEKKVGVEVVAELVVNARRNALKFRPNNKPEGEINGSMVRPGLNRMI
ncbi:hypothetical protein IEQ34_015316 [Dendrobium chrysotoxum]|uniref:Uncharacterized protein n=1 Tax=Dendrobium chrysotoxum TaxID=161865 RepID=A0AAV7GI21_DENCH|nr:hypothetical protein IEQ34_015316 [Dendrobium chrysotoxum]